jgi:tetratricopeptide (TPR) repeat protein
MDSNTPQGWEALQQRIERLHDAVDWVRGPLKSCLRVADDPKAALSLARGVAEQLAKRVLQDIGIKPPSMLEACLKELEGEKVMSRGLVHAQIITLLHSLRVWGNKAYHDDMQVPPTREDVNLFLGSALRVVDWYCYEFERGPKVARPAPGPGAGGAAPGGRPAGTRKPRVVGRRLLDVSLFKGRAAEEAKVGRLLAEGTPRLVSIFGRGGMGKTALACRVLRGLEQGRWPQPEGGPAVDGVAYLSTRTDGVTLERLYLDGADLLGEAGARFKNVWSSRDLKPAEKVARLLEAFEGGFYIALLDNLEDLADADGALTDPELVTFFQEWPRAPGGLRVLITSRVPLRFGPEAERRHRHVPLEEGLSTREGVQLLRELDPNGEHGVSTAPEGKLARAVRTLHGVPRALELVVSLLSPDNGAFVTLDEVVEGFYSEEEVVERLVEENYRRLSPDARRVAEALAVYREPVPEEAVSFLLGPFAPGLDVPTVLGRLVKTRLVQADRAARTATLHPIDQAYLYQGLPQQGEGSRAAMHGRAADYYRQQRGAEGGVALSLHSRLDWSALGPRVAEFEHRASAGQLEVASELLGDFGPSLALRGSASRCRAMVQAVRGRVRGDRAQLALLTCETALRVQLGPVGEALRVGEQARAAAAQLGCPRAGAAVETLLGVACRFAGDARCALDHFERALELHGRSGDTSEESDRLLVELSLASSYTGNVRRALEYGSRLLNLVGQGGDPQLQMGMHDALSLAYFAWRRWDEAIQHCQAALSAWEAGMNDAKAYVLNILGMSHFLAGRYPQAAVALRDGQAAAAELESPRAAGFCLLNLALVHYLAGAAAEAGVPAAEAQPLLDASGCVAAGAALQALLTAAVAGDRAAEAAALLEVAGRLSGNPDLFPADELATRARDLAAGLGRDDLVAQAQESIDKTKAQRTLPDQ